MTPPRVSVVLSVYNGERYLGAALDSLLVQTLTDFELVLVDDASTDATPEIVSAYAGRDARIVSLRNAENLGLTRSLNRVLGRLRGDLVARQDADDLSCHQRLERQVALLDRRPDLGAVSGSFEALDHAGEPRLFSTVPSEPETIRAHLLFENRFPHSTLMIRRSLLEELGGYDERLPYAQDYDLWWRVSRRRGISAVPEKIAGIRTGHAGRLAEVYREEQRRCGLEISGRIVREVLGESWREEEHAAPFARFWRELHGEATDLGSDDVTRLRPLWRELATVTACREVWGPRFSALAQRLAARRPAAARRFLRDAVRPLDPWRAHRATAKLAVAPLLRPFRRSAE